MSSETKVLCVDLGSPQGFKKKKKEKKEGTVPRSFHSPAHVQSMAIPQSAAQASHLFYFFFPVSFEQCVPIEKNDGGRAALQKIAQR